MAKKTPLSITLVTRKKADERAQSSVHLKAWKPPQPALPSLADQLGRRGCAVPCKGQHSTCAPRGGS